LVAWGHPIVFRDSSYSVSPRPAFPPSAPILQGKMCLLDPLPPQKDCPQQNIRAPFAHVSPIRGKRTTRRWPHRDRGPSAPRWELLGPRPRVNQGRSRKVFLFLRCQLETGPVNWCARKSAIMPAFLGPAAIAPRARKNLLQGRRSARQKGAYGRPKGWNDPGAVLDDFSQ